MAISESKKKIVIDNYFKRECDVNTSIKEAFTKGFELGLKKAQPKTGHWIKEESICGWDRHSYQCSECGRSIHLDTEVEDLEDYPYCHCGAEMQEVKE